MTRKKPEPKIGSRGYFLVRINFVGKIMGHGFGRTVAGKTGLVLALLGFEAIGVARAQTPGDTRNLAGVHPGYTLINLRPSAIAEGIGGMDFLPDGRLAICTWNGNHDPVMTPVRKGNLYILSGVELDDPAKVTYKKFAANLEEPLGLKAVGDTLYVSERQGLLQLVDMNKDGVADSSSANPKAGYKAVASYTSGNSRHEYFFGLLYKGGFFYGAHSLSLDNGGTAAIPQPHANRGTFVKVNRATGATEHIAGGARQPFGVAWGPEGEMFATDVQGTWLPASKLNHVKAGANYGHPQRDQSPANPWDSKPFQPPAVYLPQSEIANAPGQPVLVPSGTFAGQMLYGDVHYGGIQRVYLEKVGTEWQGAVFRFSAGFEGGVGRLVYGPDGALYVGQVGHNSGNWIEPAKKEYGLAKLKANGKSAFEMLRVISRAKGMEIEMTEPVSDDFATASKYQISSYYFTPTAAYGGNKQGVKPLTPKSVTVDPASGRKVFLEIDGLEAKRAIYIRLVGLKSKAGAALWSTEAWYTLNAIGTGNAFDPVVAASPSPDRKLPLELVSAAGRVSITLPFDGDYALRLLDASGAVRASVAGTGLRGGAAALATAGLPRGVYALALRGAGREWSRAVVIR